MLFELTISVHLEKLLTLYTAYIFFVPLYGFCYSVKKAHKRLPYIWDATWHSDYHDVEPANSALLETEKLKALK